MILETKRLIMRPYESQDEPFVYEVINSVEIARTTLHIPYPYPREQVGVWMHFTLKNRLYKRGYEWGIFTHQGQYIGNIGIVNIDRENQSGEVTYFIGEAFWNQGYATEAVKRGIRFGFSELGLERIQGRVMTCNPASLRVLEKCAFQYEGLMKHAVCKKDIFYDLWLTALIKQEFLEVISKETRE